MRPRTASPKASTVVGRSGARENPSVSNDEPLVTKAARRGCTPSAQNMAVQPTSVSASHTTGSVIRLSGA